MTPPLNAVPPQPKVAAKAGARPRLMAGTAARRQAEGWRPGNAGHVFMASRGIRDANWPAGPQIGLSHDARDVDRSLRTAACFPDTVS